MKIIEVTNVDFSLRHFLLPLMRALRARGHEVVGMCAEGRLLEEVPRRGVSDRRGAIRAQLSPLAHAKAFRDLVRLLRAERPDLVHAHMPISGFLARLAARLAGVPRVAYTCHGFLFNQPGSLPRRAVGLAMEWIGGRITDIFLTVSDRRRRRTRAGCTSFATPSPSAMAATRQCFRPDAAARAARPRRAGNSGGPGGGCRGFPDGPRQGLSGTGRRDARVAGGGALGGRRAADV